MTGKTPTSVDDNAIEQEIKAKGLTAPRVTPDRIDALMERVKFNWHVQESSTFCHAFLDGEFYLATGHSACVSKANFNAELGQKISKENALKAARDRLWELEGYALRGRLEEGLSVFDADLGQSVRRGVDALKAASVRLDRPVQMSALLTLIEMMVESNAGEMDVTLEGVTLSRVDVGDWSIKIERFDETVED